MFIKKLSFFTDREDKRTLALIFLLSLLIGFIELLGVASIVPFIGLLNDPDYIADNKYFLIMNNYLLLEKDSLVFIAGIFMITTFITINLLNAFNLWITTKYGALLSHKISMMTSKSYLNQSYKYFVNADISSVSKNILEESGALSESIFIPFMQIISKVIIIILISSLLITVDFNVFIYSLLIFLFIFIVLFTSIKNKIKRYGTLRLSANDVRFKSVNDCLGGIKDVKFYNAEQYYLDNFSNSQKDFLAYTVKCIVLSTMPRYIIEIIAFGGFFSVILYMKFIGADISLHLPIISLFILAAYRLLPAINQIYSLSSSLRFHMPALDIIHQVVTLKRNHMHNYSIEKIGPQIIFDDVSFSYNNQDPVLLNVNLEIKSSTINAIIGETGSGKTTLLDLLLGFYKPTSGKIKINESLVNHSNNKIKIGYVSQKVSFVDDSVAKNIAFGLSKDEINIEKINRLIDIVILKEVINMLPNKLNEKIGEDGAKLSGGQLQRIGIARALYLEPEILVLDEATNALDINTERLLFNSIKKHYKNITIIWITHRASSLSLCNNIYHLNKNNIKLVDNFKNNTTNDEYINKILTKET